MRDRSSQLHRARIVASIAATAISLACGTNYVYSAWAPQFADRLKLSSTESNLVGAFGNMGMYLCGAPIGYFIDGRGPRPAFIGGAILLALGYFPLHQAYDAAAGAIWWLCVCSFLSGLGGCMAFIAAIKTSALNWPHHRGTATAFPLAAFGLSAFFFSTLGSLLFSGDTSAFLMLLACGTSGLIVFGFFFVRVLPPTHTHSAYHALPANESGAGGEDSQPLSRTPSDHAKPHHSGSEPGTSSNTATSPDTKQASVDVPETAPLPGGVSGTPPASKEPPPDADADADADDALADADADEASSLISCSSSSSSLPGDVLVQSSVDMDRSHRVDIRGFFMLRHWRFWQLFATMGILAGIGLMTINNVGNVVKALWSHYDDSVSEEFMVKNQQMHVSILSVCSFAGRLLSGVGSDFLVKVVHANRVWCLVAASLIFSAAQVCAINITNPHLLGFVSGLSGLGYGFLFGVFPSIVAETFGIHGLSTNWGFMTISPIVSGNIFNLFYGSIYDKHSIIDANGDRKCQDGLECYRSAYLVTLAASALGLAVALWIIRRERLERTRQDKGVAGD